MNRQFERSRNIILQIFLFFLLSICTAASSAEHGATQSTKNASTSTKKPSSGRRAYLSQAYIDSIVNRGFYELTEGTSFPDVGKKQEEAIKKAKMLGNHLLQLAKGDPNEKYIQWRVGELFAQIALEEQEIRERKERERISMVNYLVHSFNIEIGKRRPDFKQLHVLLEQLEAVDPLKANEMEESINSRSRSISREIVANIERLLSKGDLDNARRELDYCDANHNFLVVPVATYAQLSAKLRSRMDILRERGLIAVQLKLAEDMLACDSLKAAAKAAADARSRLTAVRTEISPQEFDRFNARYMRVMTAIEEKENQLVQKSFELLHTKGVDAAIAFLDNEMKGYSPSRAKTVMVNNAIIDAILEDRRKAAEHDTAISPEIASLLNQKADPGLSVEALTAAAKQRAQARADSARLATMSGRQRRAWRRKQKEMRAAAEAKQRFASRTSTSAHAATQQSTSPLTTSATAMTPPAVTAEPPPSNSHAERQAKECLISIYLMLEQNKVAAAHATYLRNEETLRTHLAPEAFEVLRTTVEQAITSSRAR